MATDSKSEIKTKSIFATPARFNENKDLATRLLNPCKELLAKCEDHNSYPNGKTSFFEEGKNIFKLEQQEFIDFRDWVGKECLSYLYECGVDINQIKIIASNAWVSEMYEGGSHPHHTHHPYCQVSGNFYVHADEESSPLTFYKPGVFGDIWQTMPIRQKNILNIDKVNCPARTGLNAIWRSDLIHSVFHNKSKSRIAISYNLVVTNV
jgi:uncharacterized protein (TIGR02466 family)